MSSSSKRLVTLCASLLAIIVLLAPKLADAQSPTALNDTGIIICYAPTSPCDPALHKKQDAMVGRDAAARTPGSGLTTSTGKGFSFTKISRGGAALPDTAVLGDTVNEWACTRDNVTGLMWEVKTTSPTSSRYKDNTYSWYNPDPSKNGGNPGVANGGACSISGRCDTDKYIQDLRSTAICGRPNWRLPVPRELQNLMDLGTPTPGNPLVSTYFPTVPSPLGSVPGNPHTLVTSTVDASDSTRVWYVYLYNNVAGVISIVAKAHQSGVWAVASPN